jgi:hypothetical protein
MLSMLLRFVRVATLIVFTTVGTVSGQAGAKVPWAVSIDPVRSPAGPNSAQPQLSASTQGQLLSWVERDGQKATLRFAERTATGWSAPRDVSSGTDWFVNWADVPSVVRHERRVGLVEDVRARRAEGAEAGQGGVARALGASRR